MNSLRHRQTGELDRQTRLLLAVNGLFVAATALSGTYFGIYLWKAGNDYIRLGWFTLLSHLAMGLTFWIGGNAAKEGNKMGLMRFGMGLSAVFYAAVLLLKNDAYSYAWLLGLVQGVAMGLFWLAFNVVYFEATEPDNRDKFNGLAGTIGSLVGIAVPWTSGVLISRFGGDRGYRVVFLASLCVFVAGIVVSFFLRNRKAKGDYDWKWGAKLIRRSDEAWRPVLGALAFQGVRESVFGVLIGVLIFAETGSEMKLGNFLLITSAVGFASYLWTGKRLKPQLRRKGMLAGATMLAAAVLPLFAGIGYGTLLAYGTATALFFPLYMLPMTSAVFDLIGRDAESAEKRVEYVVAREIALNVGRIAGMAIFMGVLSVSREPIALKSLLLAVGTAPIVSWFYMRKLLEGTGGASKVDAKPRGVL